MAATYPHAGSIAYKWRMGMGSVLQLFKRATSVFVITIAEPLEPGNDSLASNKESGVQ